MVKSMSVVALLHWWAKGWLSILLPYTEHADSRELKGVFYDGGIARDGSLSTEYRL